MCVCDACENSPFWPSESDDRHASSSHCSMKFVCLSISNLNKQTDFAISNEIRFSPADKPICGRIPIKCVYFGNWWFNSGSFWNAKQIPSNQMRWIENRSMRGFNIEMRFTFNFECALFPFGMANPYKIHTIPDQIHTICCMSSQCCCICAFSLFFQFSDEHRNLCVETWNHNNVYDYDELYFDA